MYFFIMDFMIHEQLNEIPRNFNEFINTEIQIIHFQCISLNNWCVISELPEIPGDFIELTTSLSETVIS